MKLASKGKNLWMANLLLVAVLLLSAILSTWLEPLPFLSANMLPRLLVSILFAILPPLLWLVLFYRLDRAEPEPRMNILKATLLGALVRQAFCAPVLSFFPAWTTAGWPQSTGDAAGVLFLSALQMASLLLVLRIGVMPMSSFNERSDGILYGAAVGLGISAAMNLAWVATSGGSLLSAAVPRMVVTSLVQASLGGLGGYWFGLSAFSRQPLWRQGVRFALLVFLGAGLQVLPQAVARQGFAFLHLVSIIPTAIGALLVFLTLVILLRRVPAGTEDRLPLASSRLDGILLGVLLMLALSGAFGLRGWQTRLVRVQPLPGVVMSQPANWQVVANPSCIYTAGDRFSGGTQTGQVRVIHTRDIMASILLDAGMGTATPGSNGTTSTASGGTASTVPGKVVLTVPTGNSAPGKYMADGELQIHRLAAWWTIRTAREAVWWKPVRTEFLYRDGRWLAVVDSIRLDEGNAGTVGGVPALRNGRDVLWQEGNDVLQVSLHAVRRDGTPDAALMAAMVSSIRFGDGAGEGGEAP